MTTNNELEILALIDRFVIGAITGPESLRLLELLDSNREGDSLFLDNVEMDFLLWERTARIQTEQEVHPSIKLPDLEVSSIELSLPNESSRFEFDMPGPDNQSSFVLDMTDFRYRSAFEKKHRAFFHSLWKKRWLYTGILSLALMLALVVYGSIAIINQPSGNSVRPVATVSELIDVQWAEGSETFKRGQRIPPKKIAIQQGIVQLTFSNESNVILEGPAEFIINDTKNVFCQQGKISATVTPKGHGFKITTPFMTVIDLGTEFFLDVTKETSNVSVIKGSVKVAESDKEPILLKMGTGLKGTINGLLEKFNMATNFDLFITPPRFEKQLKAYTQREKERQKQEAVTVCSMPGLIGWFHPGDVSSSDSIVNQSPKGRQSIPSAKLYGCKQTEGSLYNTNAVHFASQKDRIEVDINQSFKSMTLITYVRIDELGRFGMNLLADQDFAQNTQRPRIIWQIAADGRLIAQFCSGKEANSYYQVFGTESALFSRDLGTWVTLAVVFDEKNKVITHYVDGKKRGECNWNPSLIELGQVTLGNSLETKQMQKTWFRGAMEDFMIFDHALTPKEIENIKRMFYKN